MYNFQQHNKCLNKCLIKHKGPISHLWFYGGYWNQRLDTRQ